MMWRKKKPCALLMGMQIGTASVESSMEISWKTKNRYTIWASNSTPEYLSEANENTNLQRYLHLCVHCSIIYNPWDMEATNVSIDKWLDKKDMIHTHTYNGMLHRSKKEWNIAICDNVGGYRGHYPKLSQSGRKRQIPHGFTYVRNPKNSLMETETKGMVARRKGVRGWAKKRKGKIVNNMVMSLHGDRWLLELMKCDHIVNYKNVKSLYDTPETNITNTILYNNYT